MKKLVLAISLIVSTMASAHCPIEFKTENLCASLTWQNPPKLDVNNTFTVKFWQKGDHNHVGMEPKNTLKMKTWMVMDNGHSHGGAAITWNELEEGVYIVENAKFFMHGMKGHWEIKIELFEEQKLIESNAVLVDLTGSGTGNGHDH